MSQTHEPWRKMMAAFSLNDTVLWEAFSRSHHVSQTLSTRKDNQRGCWVHGTVHFYSERCVSLGRYLDGLYLWGPDHSLPRIGREGGYRHQWLEWSWTGRLNQDVEKRPGLDGNIVLSKKHREPSLGCRASSHPRWWPRHPILGGSDCPDAPGTGHTQPGQGTLAGFLATAGSRVSLCLFLSPLALGVTGSEQTNGRASFRDCLGAWN